MTSFRGRTLSLLLAAIMLHISLAQQDFSAPQVPDPFEVGDMYPPRSEIEVCRAIQDYIDRSSARFDSQLVTNTNPDIIFDTPDSRIMSSRLQSRLDTLAASYKRDFGRKMTVLKAWTPFPDPDLSGDDLSLHYEGRTVQIRLSRSGHYDNLMTLAVEARFDWVFFASSNLIRLSVIPTTCERNIDCVFMLDQSGSVGESNHNLAKDFIENVVSFFSIGPDQTRVGLVTYSTSARLDFDLNEHTTLSNLQTAISNVPYRGGWTATALALNGTNLVLDSTMGYGARPSVDGIPKIAILITDGKSNQYPLTYAAPALKNAGVQVYTIGVGNYDLDELRFISSDPDDEHVFLLSSYRDALGFVDFLSVTTCETQAIIRPCENTVSSVPEDILQYYQAVCPSFHSSVIVELNDIGGSTFLYCSTTTANPGPLTTNTIRDESTGVTNRRCEISLSPGSDVFIGVQGQDMTNTFSLVIMDQLFDISQVYDSVVEGDAYSYDLTSHFLPAVAGETYDYEIVEGNGDNVFRVTTDGILSIRNAAVSTVNYNNKPFYSLSIVASRSNSDCNCARIRVRVDVIPNRVDFNPAVLPDVEVPEDASVGHDVVTVSATSGAGEIAFSIVGGNTGNTFRINSASGLIEVSSALNFETRMSYSLTIEAAAIGTSVSDTIDQTIIITDVNESPFFVTQCALNGDCSFSLDENQSIGTFIGDVVADDPDLSSLSNGMLNYRLSPLSPLFSVDSNGRIVTTEMLDHEEGSTYLLDLIVSDSCSGCSISISTTIQIVVSDLNDNPPVIDGPTMVEIDENTQDGFVLTQYSATDDDSGANARVEFSVSFSDGFLPFDIDSGNGLLTVTGDIDYEMVQAYNITVTATNPGSTQSSSINTRIVVLNLNDETPAFTSTYSESVAENSVGNTLVVPVEATDADLGSHGVIRYSILEGNFDDSFQIDEESGAISVAKPIDRETIAMFQLVVRARDQGTPQSRHATTNVPITITDVNDNTPIFNPASYSASLREDTSTNTDIFTVFASDNDEPGNPNSAIVYSITLGNVGSVFSIDGSSGVVTLVGSLDFETLDSYSLTIVAIDQGTPSLQAMATATITVLNVNESPPVLSGNQTINISESAPVNLLVADFDAEDPDQMIVIFSIGSGNEESKFIIGESTGAITLVESLDFETTPQYSIEIVVSDGVQSTSAFLSVIVLDENEFTPQFNGSTEFEIAEEEPSGTSVGSVHAVDMDGSAPNSAVSYAFAQQSQITQYFDLDQDSGEITTNGVLDREELTQVFVPPASSATVSIVARDQGSPSRQSFVSITITLVDINDNDPMFTDAMYENSLLENLAPDQIVFQLSATDRDLGTNAEIRFLFQLNDNVGESVPFRIDEVGGLVDTNDTLDCELQPSYSFTLYAVDLGSPSRSSTVPGLLNIIDENDNSPIFTMDPYTYTVLENTETGVVVGQVEAKDADKGLNGEVVYSVINADLLAEVGENQVDDVPFLEINSSTGVLRPVTSFDFEREQRVNVTVVAKDMGVPRRTGTAQVIFIITNFDELPPSFPDLCTFTVPEDVSIGEVVAECVATDVDNNAVSEDDILVAYGIFSGNDDDTFTINVNTSELSLAKNFDRESKSFYRILLQGRDLSGRTEHQYVEITVSDVNDNAPQFTAAPYSYDFTVARIQNQVQELITISATDDDIGENSDITYSIGNIVRNELSSVIEIIATDQGSPALSTSAELTIMFERDCLLQSYFIGESSGIVYAYVLCSVDISPPILNVTRGSSNTFRCSVLYNSRLTHQWIQNGSFVTQPTFVVNKEAEVSYTIIDARFEDQGEYACKITTSAGSLQSVTRSANVQVRPTITVPPKDQTAKAGDDATFTCLAVGIPDPRIEWYRDTEKISEGSPLVISNVDSSKVGSYSCVATNTVDGSDSVVVIRKLTLYKPENVVELSLDGVSSTSEDGSCHYIDYDVITTTISDLTSQTTIITGVEGDNICEVTPCMPSPCKNGGSCDLDDKANGGYTCTCSDGYTGRNCSMDIKDCEDTPCENEGTCVEVVGSFQCVCKNGTSGHRCQYLDTCKNSDPCTQGSFCVDTSGGGFECVEEIDPSTTLVVSGLNIDPGFLNDFVQAYLEKLLASSSSNGRRRRQSNTFTTLCEPRFVEVSTDAYALIWLCPDGETAPTGEEQAILCNVLLESGHVGSCTPPGGEELVLTTPAPLPVTKATVGIILIKPTSSTPLDALVVIDALETMGAQNELAENLGVDVGKIEAQVSGPRITDPGGLAPDTSSVPAGIAVGVILGLLLVAGLIVLAIVSVLKYTHHKKRQSRKRDHALERALSLHSIQRETNGFKSAGEENRPPLKTTPSTTVLIDNEQEADYDELPPISNGEPDFDDPVYTNHGAVP